LNNGLNNGFLSNFSNNSGLNTNTNTNANTVTLPTTMTHSNSNNTNNSNHSKLLQAQLSNSLNTCNNNGNGDFPAFPPQNNHHNHHNHMNRGDMNNHTSTNMNMIINTKDALAISNGPVIQIVDNALSTSPGFNEEVDIVKVEVVEEPEVAEKIETLAADLNTNMLMNNPMDTNAMSFDHCKDYLTLLLKNLELFRQHQLEYSTPTITPTNNSINSNTLSMKYNNNNNNNNFLESNLLKSKTNTFEIKEINETPNLTHNFLKDTNTNTNTNLEDMEQIQSREVIKPISCKITDAVNMNMNLNRNLANINCSVIPSTSHHTEENITPTSKLSVSFNSAFCKKVNM